MADSTQTKPCPLSRRQLQILELAAKIHMGHIMATLDVPNRTAAVVRALTAGWITGWDE